MEKGCVQDERDGDGDVDGTESIQKEDAGVR
jgi:hypothetical protein